MLTSTALCGFLKCSLKPILTIFSRLAAILAAAAA